MANTRTEEAGHERAACRRHGAVLERAILEAALAELARVGWNGLTMEGVAAAARTGKAAVYRRWSGKEELVAEALRAALPSLDEVPDLGGVREDLHALCRMIRDAMFSASGTALRSVLHECDGAGGERFHGLIRTGVIDPGTRLIRAVLARGRERGDVRSDSGDGLVVDVLPALLMYRSKVHGSEWPDAEVAELVDQVLVPLLRPGAH
ncbi:TetR/AcrR family transcriptional regulator [Streptomyces sp. NPDC046887]|uniref:TetR/AcrR family transcriptional regulator n=1 Tax=Streptomyces sp. NPDC046887 TaxID=3155472 RepID=UPI003405A2B2